MQVKPYDFGIVPFTSIYLIYFHITLLFTLSQYPFHIRTSPPPPPPPPLPPLPP